MACLRHRIARLHAAARDGDRGRRAGQRLVRVRARARARVRVRVRAKAEIRARVMARSRARVRVKVTCLDAQKKGGEH